MARLTFTPIAKHSTEVRALAEALDADYMTDGPATHAALTANGEAAIAYPLGSSRIILMFRLANAAEYIRLAKAQDNARSEDEEQTYIDERIRVGSPDEYEMEADEMKRADNGDGTFTLNTRVSLF